MSSKLEAGAVRSATDRGVNAGQPAPPRGRGRPRSPTRRTPPLRARPAGRPPSRAGRVVVHRDDDVGRIGGDHDVAQDEAAAGAGPRRCGNSDAFAWPSRWWMARADTTRSNGPQGGVRPGQRPAGPRPPARRTAPGVEHGVALVDADGRGAGDGEHREVSPSVPGRGRTRRSRPRSAPLLQACVAGTSTRMSRVAGRVEVNSPHRQDAPECRGRQGPTAFDLWRAGRYGVSVCERQLSEMHESMATIGNGTGKIVTDSSDSVGRMRHNGACHRRKNSGSSQAHEHRPQGRAGPWACRECNRPPLSRGARDLQAQAGPQAHARLHRQAAGHDRRPARRGRRPDPAAPAPGAEGPPRRALPGRPGEGPLARWRSSSSRWPRPTASARASPTRPGAPPASAPPCCRRPRSRGRAARGPSHAAAAPSAGCPLRRPVVCRLRLASEFWPAPAAAKYCSTAWASPPAMTCWPDGASAMLASKGSVMKSGSMRAPGMCSACRTSRDRPGRAAADGRSRRPLGQRGPAQFAVVDRPRGWGCPSPARSSR